MKSRARIKSSARGVPSTLNRGLLAALLLTTTMAQVPRAAITQNPELLEPGKPLERVLKGGEIHTFELKLVSGQVVRLVADQRGIDVTLKVSSPDGTTISEVNNSRSERGLESVSLVTETSGGYRLEVHAANETAVSGRYEVRIERAQTATEQDRKLVEAERAFSEANKLLMQGTSESSAQAIAKYKAILPVFELAGEPRMKASILNRIGTGYSFGNDYLNALEYYNQALQFARAAGDQLEEASALTNLGQTQRLMSQNGKALEYLNQALQLWQLLEAKRDQLDTLRTIGGIHYLLGDLYKSLAYYDQAIELARAIRDRNREARLLSSIGLAHYEIGDYQQALEIWQKGLDLSREIRNRGVESSILAQLGSVYDAVGEQQKALVVLNQATQMARDNGDQLRVATTLQTIGRVYRSLGEYRKSIEYLEQSLVLLKDLRSPSAEARAYYNLGKAYDDLGEYQTALDYLNRALPIWNAAGDVVNAAANIFELARIERNRGHPDTALAHNDAALSIIEGVRTNAGRDELRAAYLASTQKYFELKVDLLLRLHKLDPSKGYAAAALQTSERARARTMLDSLSETGIDIREGAAPDLLERERRIQKELSAKAIEQVRFAGVKVSEEQVIRNRKEIEDLSAQYGKVEGEIRAASHRYASLIPPQPLDLAEIRRRVIDDQTVLLEYYLGDERSYLWAVTSNSIETYELPKRDVIEKMARQVYELLTARNRHIKFETADERRKRIEQADSDYPKTAAALSRIVLAPAAAQLPNKRLLIVSDGALQYIPFAALPAPGPEARSPSLGLMHEVVSLPSASTLAMLRREIAGRSAAPRTLAVLADPVFDINDERVKVSLTQRKPNTTIAKSRRVTASEMERSASESGWEGEAITIARLPFTRREADVISALVPAAQRKEALDFAASLTNAMSADLAEYRIVHFATHGFLNSRHPELSGLVLSLVDEGGAERDGFLRAHEIFNLRLPADLVVLSGCRTGLGKEIKGEGLVGLTRAFMHAGAARVMVSLWDVNDEATAELMKRFYGGLLGRAELSPAAALRSAQVSLSQEKRWSAPYYWAGFTLQGEPR